MTNMKQIMIRLWLILAFASLTACSQERTNEPAPATQEVTARLSAEIDLPLDELRMVTVPLADNGRGGYAINLDALTSNGKVTLKCIIRSDDPTQPSTYVEIPFIREGKRLKIGGQNVALAPGTDFTNAGGRNVVHHGIPRRREQSNGAKIIALEFELYNYQWLPCTRTACPTSNVSLE